MRRPSSLLLGAGAVLLAVAAVLALVFRHTTPSATSVTVSVPARTVTTTIATTTTPATTTTAPAPPPRAASFSWDGAGAIVWHLGDVGPSELGQALRNAGFDWVAVYLGAPGDPQAPDPGWLYRFRLASGLPIGGWSVLGDNPAVDAANAVNLVRQDGLAFYIADAEAPYGYTDGRNLSGVRYARSRQFVNAFRAAEPTLPAGVSSYCRADQHDLDWSAWAGAAFVFLPQAYVNDFGAAAAPAACVQGAAKWFAPASVHPTVGSFQGMRGLVAPSQFAQLLAQAHTVGFSIYPAEVGMTTQDWQAYGSAISALGIAKQP